jgi:hypothetical protein
MKQFHVNRLKRLRQILVDLHGNSNRVCLRVFAVPNTDEEGHTCGTLACVLGWAGLDPNFRRRGLKTTLDGCRGEVNLFDEKTGDKLNFLTFGAGRIFFGLPEAWAKYLFTAREEEERQKFGLDNDRLIAIARIDNVLGWVKVAYPTLKV